MVKEWAVSRITDVSICELRDWGLFPDRASIYFFATLGVHLALYLLIFLF